GTDRRLRESRVESDSKGRTGQEKAGRKGQTEEVLRMQPLHPRVTPLLWALGNATILTKDLGLCHFVTLVEVNIRAAVRRKRWRLRSLAVCDQLAQIVYAIFSEVIRVGGS